MGCPADGSTPSTAAHCSSSCPVGCLLFSLLFPTHWPGPLAHGGAAGGFCRAPGMSDYLRERSGVYWAGKRNFTPKYHVRHKPQGYQEPPTFAEVFKPEEVKADLDIGCKCLKNVPGMEADSSARARLRSRGGRLPALGAERARVLAARHAVCAPVFHPWGLSLVLLGV